MVKKNKEITRSLDYLKNLIVNKEPIITKKKKAKPIFYKGVIDVSYPKGE